jgi:hypothetical protein
LQYLDSKRCTIFQKHKYGTERLRNVPKVTQLVVHGDAWLSFLLKSLCFHHHLVFLHFKTIPLKNVLVPDLTWKFYCTFLQNIGKNSSRSGVRKSVWEQGSWFFGCLIRYKSSKTYLLGLPPSLLAAVTRAVFELFHIWSHWSMHKYCSCAQLCKWGNTEVKLKDNLKIMCSKHCAWCLAYSRYKMHARSFCLLPLYIVQCSHKQHAKFNQQPTQLW